MLLGADLMPLVRPSVSQLQPHEQSSSQDKTGESIVRSVNQSNKFSVEGKTWAVHKYPELFSRTGRASNHVVNTKFKTQQKGSWVPVGLQSRVKTELKHLITDTHVKKFRSCTDDQFISPIVPIHIFGPQHVPVRWQVLVSSPNAVLYCPSLDRQALVESKHEYSVTTSIVFSY